MSLEPMENYTQTAVKQVLFLESSHEPGTFTKDLSGVGAPPVTELALLVVVNLLCLLVISFRNKHKIWQFVPDQGVSVAFGIIVGALFVLFNITNFSEQLITNFSGIFFEFCVPPLIFAASYGIKQKAFFKNLGSILIFSIFGTVMSAFIIGYGVYFVYNSLLDRIDVTISEGRKMPLVDALMLGALLSAVDPGATTQAMTQNSDRHVYSLLFGEKILNGAVAIVLYNRLALMHEELKQIAIDKEIDFAELELSYINYGALFVRFVVVCVSSTIIGTIIALISALAIKHGGLKNSPGKEQALILLFAYMSYLVARMMAVSAVMSLFITGAVMSHYTFYNLTEMSQVATASSFSAIAQVAEIFVFVFLGISAIPVLSGEGFLENKTFIGFLLILCLVSRFIQIVLLSALINFMKWVYGVNHYISIRAQIFLSWSGVRGAVAFALALHAPVLNENGVMLAATISVILFTFIVEASSAQCCAYSLGLTYEPNVTLQEHSEMTANIENEANKQIFQDRGAPLIVHDRRSPSIFLEAACSPRTAALHRCESNEFYEEYGTLLDTWRKFDDKYLKPIFGGKPRETSENIFEREYVNPSAYANGGTYTNGGIYTNGGSNLIHEDERKPLIAPLFQYVIGKSNVVPEENGWHENGWHDYGSVDS